MTHTILVIDNDSAQRNLLCATLKEKLAYDVVSVADGREAITMLMSHPRPRHDLILYDVSDVKVAAETIAGLNVIAKNTPVVTLVGYGDYEAATALMAVGAQDFLSKPVAIERLGTTFRNCLRLRDAQRQTEFMRSDTTSETLAFSEYNNYNAILPFSWLGEDGNMRRMEQIEAEAIRFAMQYYNGRMTEVARRLGIGRSTLYRKLGEMNVRQAHMAPVRQKHTAFA